MSGVETVAVVSLAGGGTPLPQPGRSIRAVPLAVEGIEALEPGAALVAAQAAAREIGADWVAAMAGGETLAPDALELVDPLLGLYDAIFGAAAVGGEGRVHRLTRLAFDAPERLPHALLNWWLPGSVMIRAGTEPGDVGAGRVGWLFGLWGRVRCLKSAQPLLALASEPEPLDEAGRAEVLRRLAETPVFLPVTRGERTWHLTYTGRNAGIEREQSRGLFYEAAELEELKAIVGEGARIADVGANSGNHTVFFAGPMAASEVVPFEPLPVAADALRAAVARNGLANVDLSRLGTGVSDKPGRARFVFSGTGGLGATGLARDAAGDVVVAPLDSMLSGRLDLLKIDVEGMELAVLAGAERTIAQSRPMIFIEIANANMPAFSAWLDHAGYSVARAWTDKGHSNFLAKPRERP